MYLAVPVFYFFKNFHVAFIPVPISISVSVLLRTTLTTHHREQQQWLITKSSCSSHHILKSKLITFPPYGPH